ncbi:hypothetical protein ACH4SP_11645 [Streptomyces sp. NPDC021093]|uniref:hypothetical protein n=1 Tax=Streptomyces sp. NPDC021093 TaxID=3365112 RepID=UPI00379840B0
MAAVHGEHRSASHTIDAYGAPLHPETGLANATVQPRVVAVRSFSEYLVEDGLRERNPVRRGKSSRRGRPPRQGLVRRLEQAPWIPNEDVWQTRTYGSGLCTKAGIPESDSPGALTSHRARATIATKLLNAKDPLPLADLQQWRGHKHPSSTRHYAKILQRTLSAAYKKADSFARNVRTIQVLIDRESILPGTAASGEQPWKYNDLGEGYCNYDFFATCPTN